MSDQSHDFPENDPIEAYCVSCKYRGDILNPQAVYTSRGQAATRGTCPECGANVFRMGRTYLHGNTPAPKPIQVLPKGAKGTAAYIVAAVTDAEFASGLAQELNRVGVYTWLDNGEEADTTAWSGGVHPALEQCSHLVIVLSGFSEKTASIQAAHSYFRSHRKPITLALIESMEPPDDWRSRPRFDFTGDYKTAFRGLMEALSR